MYMQIKNLVQGMFNDDDGVSPVIGVILMVAITVILAAVIGTFVLNNNNLSETSPQVNWDYSANAGTDLTVTHEGGESVNTDRLTVNAPASSGNAVLEFDEIANGPGLDSELSAGSSFTVQTSDEDTDNSNKQPTLASDDTVRIVWSAEGGGSTATIGQYQIP